ncbi:hypothetical protein KUCAC02_002274, partial [Chaenocephalus aceratus]
HIYLYMLFQFHHPSTTSAAPSHSLTPAVHPLPAPTLQAASEAAQFLGHGGGGDLCESWFWGTADRSWGEGAVALELEDGPIKTSQSVQSKLPGDPPKPPWTRFTELQFVPVCRTQLDHHMLTVTQCSMGYGHHSMLRAPLLPGSESRLRRYKSQHSPDTDLTRPGHGPDTDLTEHLKPPGSTVPKPMGGHNVSQQLRPLDEPV